MQKGKARKQAIEIYMKLFGKKPDKQFDPFLDLLNATEYEGIKIAAKAEDKLYLMQGMIQAAKDHYRKYGVLMAKYNALQKAAKEEHKENEHLKRINEKYANAINKKIAKLIKYKKKQYRKRKP